LQSFSLYLRAHIEKLKSKKKGMSEDIPGIAAGRNATRQALAAVEALAASSSMAVVTDFGRSIG
jgi:hypothetical protein